MTSRRFIRYLLLPLLLLASVVAAGLYLLDLIGVGPGLSAIF